MGARGLRRRKFLKAGGTAAGALIVGGGGIWVAGLKPVREILEPDTIEFFAGKMDYRKLALAPRLVVRGMKVPEGDFRNWDAIGAWADALCKQMKARGVDAAALAPA